MSIEKISTPLADQTRLNHQSEANNIGSAAHDGSRASFRGGLAEVVSLHRNGKRIGGSLPTALGGRIPQHPVFVPAGQKLTSSERR